MWETIIKHIKQRNNAKTMEMAKPRKRRKQRKRKHLRRRQKAAAVATAAEAAIAERPPGEIWSSTYKSLVEWHRQQVLSFCRGGVEEEQDQEESSTQEEEEEIEENPLLADCIEEDVDADYLSFLEVTLKHQQELRQLRAEALATMTIPSAEN